MAFPCSSYGTSPDSLRTFTTPQLRKFLYFDSADVIPSISAYHNFLKKEREVQQLAKLLGPYRLPAGSRPVEYAALPGFPHRALLLWMMQPRVVVNPDEVYTCPEVTKGKGYYYGITYISLLNTKNKAVINTLAITNPEAAEMDTSEACFAVPFSILNPAITNTIGGLKYHAIGGTDTTDGRAVVLHLADYNGDNRPLEFALYYQHACMGCATTLFGYSPKLDKVLQYEVELLVDGLIYSGKPVTENNEIDYRDTTYTDTIKWIDQAFIFRPDSLGQISYNIDYSGRGGFLDRYSIRFNKEKERFEGTFTNRPHPGDEEEPLRFYTQPKQTKQEY